MNIFFYCPWHDKNHWLKQIKKTFKNNKILTLENKPDLSKIEYAIIWNLPNQIFKKLKNIKLIFSMGAGVDHIINLSSYKGTPIIRIKDPIMGERMSNHIISQILIYQLNLDVYFNAQKEKKWINEFIVPTENKNILIGLLGLGYLGSIVAKKLLKFGYNIQGFKNSSTSAKYPFSVYFKDKDLIKFIKSSDVIVSILPATTKTKNLIDKNFLNRMKKNSFLIIVG